MHYKQKKKISILLLAMIVTLMCLPASSIRTYAAVNVSDISTYNEGAWNDLVSFANGCLSSAGAASSSGNPITRSTFNNSDWATIASGYAAYQAGMTSMDDGQIINAEVQRQQFAQTVLQLYGNSQRQSMSSAERAEFDGIFSVLDVKMRKSDGEYASDDDEEQKQYESLVEALENECFAVKDTDPKLYDIKMGERIIDSALDRSLYDASQKVQIRKSWKLAFEENALMLGIQASVGDNETLQQATGAINALTWESDVPEGVDASNAGLMGRLLTTLYNVDGTSAHTKVGDFIGIIKGLGMSLAICFCVMNMTNMMTERNMTGEAIGREFAKLMFGIWLIGNFQYIGAAIIRLGSILLRAIETGEMFTTDHYDIQSALVSSLAKVLRLNDDLGRLTIEKQTGISGAWSGFVDMFDRGGSTGAIDVVTGKLCGYIHTLITPFVSKLTIYSVAIETTIMYLFMPIALADMYSEKFRSAGVRFLKSFAACALTGVVMYFVIFVTSELSKLLLTKTLVTRAIIEVTMLGMLGRSRSIANQIIGVR